MAMGAERCVLHLDAVLGRMREDLLRAGLKVRAPGFVTRDAGRSSEAKSQRSRLPGRGQPS